MRFITAVLLILVFFFGGMIYGSYEKGQQPFFEKADKESEIMQMEPYHEEKIEPAIGVASDADTPLITRIASMFESMVVSIYELCINIMYSIADLFFKI